MLDNDTIAHLELPAEPVGEPWSAGWREPLLI